MVRSPLHHPQGKNPTWIDEAKACDFDTPYGRSNALFSLFLQHTQGQSNSSDAEIKISLDPSRKDILNQAFTALLTSCQDISEAYEILDKMVNMSGLYPNSIHLSAALQSISRPWMHVLKEEGRIEKRSRHGERRNLIDERERRSSEEEIEKDYGQKKPIERGMIDTIKGESMMTRQPLRIPSLDEVKSLVSLYRTYFSDDQNPDVDEIRRSKTHGLVEPVGTANPTDIILNILEMLLLDSSRHALTDRTDIEERENWLRTTGEEIIGSSASLSVPLYRPSKRYVDFFTDGKSRNRRRGQLSE